MRHSFAIRMVGLLTLAFSNTTATAATFDAFIERLSTTPLESRSEMVEQYLATTHATPLVDVSGTVHFVWFGDARSVAIEGDLQKAWSSSDELAKIECGESDLFYVSYEVPADAVLEYRFIVDGERKLDPRNTRVVQSFDFGDRSLVTLPGFIESPSTKLRSNIPKGKTERWLYKTNHPTFTNQLVWIYKPHGYSSDKKYPIVYVLDGMWALYTRPFINVVDNLIHDGRIPPTVVVFLSFEDRWIEYVERSTEYAAWLVEEMVPFVESNVVMPASADRRAIMGASAAGHGAIVAALRHPEVFGSVASQGGGAGGYPGHNPLANEALDIYLTKRAKYPLRRLYSEVATYDLVFPQFGGVTFLEGARQFRGRLQHAQIAHVYREVNGGHTGFVWDQSLGEILIYLSQLDPAGSGTEMATAMH